MYGKKRKKKKKKDYNGPNDVNGLYQNYLDAKLKLISACRKMGSKYYQTQVWKKRRGYVFKMRGNVCELCGSKDDVQVHHLTYKNKGCENLEDMLVLCRSCHEKAHGIVPGQEKPPYMECCICGLVLNQFTAHEKDGHLFCEEHKDRMYTRKKEPSNKIKPKLSEKVKRVVISDEQYKAYTQTGYGLSGMSDYGNQVEAVFEKLHERRMKVEKNDAK